MKYLGIEVGTPTIELIEDCIKRMEFNLDARKIYDKYSSKGWKTNKGKEITSLEIIVIAMNGVCNPGSSKKNKPKEEKKPKRKKQKQKTPAQSRKKRQSNRSVLFDKVLKYDTEMWARDSQWLAYLQSRCPDGFDWIESTMHGNREKSTMSELLVADYLIRNNIEFLHQAPFIIDGKTYFADFYLVGKKRIVEVDGSYHYSIVQIAKDTDRDNAFLGIGISTTRIPNEATSIDEELEKYFNYPPLP